MGKDIHEERRLKGDADRSSNSPAQISFRAKYFENGEIRFLSRSKTSWRFYKAAAIAKRRRVDGNKNADPEA